MKRTPLIVAIAMTFIAFNAYSMPAKPSFFSNVSVAAAWSTQAGEPAKKPKKEKKSKAKKGGGVSFYEGSGETRAERDKRLSRECRGRSNSGLCEGYARP